LVAASSEGYFPGKWGHFQDALGRPHGVGLAVALGKELAADQLLLLQLGAGAAGLLTGALLYFLGYLHGRASSDRDDSGLA
jgi:hypothetical protein